MERRVSRTYEALVGGLTSLPVLALLHLGQQVVGLPFVPFDLFDWLARVLPGGIVTISIDAIVMVVGALRLGATDAVAKGIEQLLALALFMVGGGCLVRRLPSCSDAGPGRHGKPARSLAAR